MNWKPAGGILGALLAAAPRAGEGGEAGAKDEELNYVEGIATVDLKGGTVTIGGVLTYVDDGTEITANGEEVDLFGLSAFLNRHPDARTTGEVMAFADKPVASEIDASNYQ